MKKRINISIIASALLAFFVWWLWHGSRLLVNSSAPLPIQGQATEPTSLSSNTTKRQSVNNPSAEESALPLEKERELYLEKARKIGKSMNRPANFYGQILDQNNQPLAGVKVKCQLSYNGDVVLPGLMPHEKILERTSDNDGRFSVQNETGLALDVKLAPVKGFEFKDGGFLGVSLRDEGVDKPAPTLSTPDKPYTFYAFKKGKAEPLFLGGIEFTHCEPDGRSYIINLRSERIEEGTSGGDLKISLKRPPGLMAKIDYDWSVQIVGTGADLLESNDEFMYEAPATGYQTSWQFARQAGAQNYTQEVHPKFYLKSHNGTMFGRLEFTILSSYKDKADIIINYALNPAGSRNLEPGGNK